MAWSASAALPASEAAAEAGAAPAQVLRAYARASHLASAHAGGLLEPLYRLHASRLKALRGPAAPLADLARWALAARPRALFVMQCYAVSSNKRSSWSKKFPGGPRWQMMRAAVPSMCRVEAHMQCEEVRLLHFITCSCCRVRKHFVPAVSCRHARCAGTASTPRKQKRWRRCCWHQRGPRQRRGCAARHVVLSTAKHHLIQACFY